MVPRAAIVLTIGLVSCLTVVWLSLTVFASARW